MARAPITGVVRVTIRAGGVAGYSSPPKYYLSLFIAAPCKNKPKC